MGRYNASVITTAGRQVLASAAAGIKLTWTRAAASSTALPSGTDLESLTALTNIKQYAPITSAVIGGVQTVECSARFSNNGINTAYNIETIGLYGQLTAGSETLIAVVTAIEADQMPAYDASAPSAFVYNIQMTVSNAADITMEVTDAGTASVADLDRKVTSDGGNISNTVVTTVTASTASYPVPAANDSMSVIIGKIQKFFADIRAVFKGATSSAAGASGQVPAPTAGQNTAYLRGDGTWTQPVNSMYATTAGVLDARVANTLYLRTNGAYITNDFTTLREAIRSQVTGARPISIFKQGSSAYTDLPSGESQTAEFKALAYGYQASLTVLLEIGGKLYERRFDTNSWVDSWRRIWTSDDIKAGGFSLTLTNGVGTLKHNFGFPNTNYSIEIEISGGNNGNMMSGVTKTDGNTCTVYVRQISSTGSVTGSPTGTISVYCMAMRY